MAKYVCRISCSLSDNLKRKISSASLENWCEIYQDEMPIIERLRESKEEVGELQPMVKYKDKRAIGRMRGEAGFRWAVDLPEESLQRIEKWGIKTPSREH